MIWCTTCNSTFTFWS